MILVLLAAGVLVHETAHAATARAYGLRCRLILKRTVIAVAVEQPSRRQSMFIALAGPIASVAFGTALLQISPAAAAVNILLGLVSLVPVKPQDGWQILRAAKP